MYGTDTHENCRVLISVVDPDPDLKGSEPFGRIRILIIGLDLDPEQKGSECKFCAEKLANANRSRC